MRLWNSVIIGNSIVWASAILASAVILKGSKYFSELIPVLAAGSAISLIILGGAKSRMSKG